MAVIGVDIGGTKLAGVLLDERILDQTWHHHRIATAKNAVEVLSDGITELLDCAAERNLSVSGVGVSIAGWLDPSRRTVVSAANLSLTDVALQAELETRHQLPVQIGNDGDCTLLGELAAGAAVGARNAVLLTFGTGVGGGIWLDGRLPVGGRGTAGELGHVPVLAEMDPQDFETCVCGGRGCLEQQTGGAALGLIAARLRDEGRSPYLASLDGQLTARDLGDAARASDQASQEAVDRAGRVIAAAVRIFIPILDPDVVILGGSVIEGLGDLILPVVIRDLASQLYPIATMYSAPAVVPAAIHKNAAAIGAAQLLTAVPYG